MENLSNNYRAMACSELGCASDLCEKWAGANMQLNLHAGVVDTGNLKYVYFVKQQFYLPLTDC